MAAAPVQVSLVSLDGACRAESAQQLLRRIERSLDIGARCQSGGGVLLHGALAERGGRGVLLLGPSGRGKTTASRRLPPPWESLSDDMSLVLPEDPGSWRAHPWVTWSRCPAGEGGSPWDAGRSAVLGGLFFLVRAPDDRVERIGAGRAACLLVESSEQAWLAGSALVADDAMKAIRGQAFPNIAALAREVPAFLLHISPAGPFWTAIEEALGGV